MHTGGDEVSPSCWENNSRIVSWLADHGMNSSELYPYFEEKVSAILRKHGKSMMAWVSRNRQNRHPGIRTGARSSLPEVAHLARCPTSLSAQALSRCCLSGRCVSEIAVECRGGPGRGSCVALARPRAAGNRCNTPDDCNGIWVERVLRRECASNDRADRRGSAS